MHHLTELPFVDEFRWVSPFHFVNNEWQNAVPLWCMLQVGPPFLHYRCAVVLRSSIVLPTVGHSSNHEYHFCQLTGQSSDVSNYYHTFKVSIWLSLFCYYFCCMCNRTDLRWSLHFVACVFFFKAIIVTSGVENDMKLNDMTGGQVVRLPFHHA